MNKLLFLFALALIVGQLSLSKNHSKNNDSNSLITIKWNKSHGEETNEQAFLALRWTYSYIGARLPTEFAKRGIYLIANKFYVDAGMLGLDGETQRVLNKLHQRIKQTHEYKSQGSIDLGKYIVLILGDSENYYNLLGVPKTYKELESNYTLLNTKGYINNSDVSFSHRIISFSDRKDNKQLFVSQEFDPVSSEILEFETMELLPNGQWRFGIFDRNGNRIEGANSKHSAAGKPAKCIWCHESKVQPLFSFQNDAANYLSYNQLNDALKRYDSLNYANQISRKDGVDFSKKSDHTLVEIIYISFMEPSAERLSHEWNVPLAKIKKRLSKLKTHKHHEFPYLGDLYHRSDVVKFASRKGLRVPESVRELAASQKSEH